MDLFVLCFLGGGLLFVLHWSVHAQSLQSCPTLSVGFPRQRYWSRLPCPLPGDLPDVSPALQADSLPTEPLGNPSQLINNVLIVSGEQQRDSAIYIHVPILPQTPLPWTVMLTLSSLPSAAQFSRSLLVIHLNYARVYMSISNFLNTDSSDPVPSASLLS